MSTADAVAILPAAGRGTRLGEPKQFLELEGIPLLVRAALAAAASPEIAALVVAVPAGSEDEVRALLGRHGADAKLHAVVAGGAERADSVRAAVAAAPPSLRYAVIHDAARPFASPALFGEVLAAARRTGAAIAALPCTDTVKQIRPREAGREAQLVDRTLDRSRLWLAQTPQAFRIETLRAAWDRSGAAASSATDEAALIEALGQEVELVPGEKSNFKVTDREDWERARRVARGLSEARGDVVGRRDAPKDASAGAVAEVALGRGAGGRDRGKLGASAAPAGGERDAAWARRTEDFTESESRGRGSEDWRGAGGSRGGQRFSGAAMHATSAATASGGASGGAGTEAGKRAAPAGLQPSTPGPGSTFTVGFGYDVHAFEEGRELILGGLRFPGEIGLAGHSDADAALHAIMDAILGAAALGDIGQHFPDTDERYRGASSFVLLGEVVRRVGQMGHRVVNVDLTIAAGRPRIGPRRAEMRERIAEGLGIPQERVNVKATTTEGLGFVGRREGIAAQAVVMLEKRPPDVEGSVSTEPTVQ